MGSDHTCGYCIKVTTSVIPTFSPIRYSDMSLRLLTQVSLRETVAMSSSILVPTAHKVFYDASLHYGAWIDQSGSQRTFAIPQGFQYSSFASEFYAAQQAIRDTTPMGNHIHLYCDNQGVCLILRNRCTAHPVRHSRIEQLLKSLLSLIDDNDIHLSVSHIPSDANPADPLSHGPPKDTDLIMAADRVLAYCKSSHHNKHVL